jgi:hypothetical protein
VIDAAGQLLPAFGDAALHRHAAAQRQHQRLEVELAEIVVVEQRVEQRVEAGEDVDRYFGEFLDEARNVARIGDEQVLRALLHAHQRVHRQREDVIERQRADIDEVFGLRLHRVRRASTQIAILLDVGQHVAMEQRRALGDAGRAAGILQEGDVVGRDIRRLEDLRAAPSFSAALNVRGRAGTTRAPASSRGARRS